MLHNENHTSTAGLFPDITIGQDYDFVFEPGIMFQYIPDISYPTSTTLGNYTITFKHADVDYVNRRYTVTLQVNPSDPGIPVQAQVPTYLIVGGLAIVIGVLTIFMLKEVRQTLPAVAPAISDMLTPIIILVVIGSLLYFAIKGT